MKKNTLPSTPLNLQCKKETLTQRRSSGRSVIPSSPNRKISRRWLLWETNSAPAPITPAGHPPPSPVPPNVKHSVSHRKSICFCCRQSVQLAQVVFVPYEPLHQVFEAIFVIEMSPRVQISVPAPRTNALNSWNQPAR
jgi:hypothetical protein